MYQARWAGEAARELAGCVQTGADDVRRLGRQVEGAVLVGWQSTAAEAYRRLLAGQAAGLRALAEELTVAARLIVVHAAAVEQVPLPDPGEAVRAVTGPVGPGNLR